MDSLDKVVDEMRKEEMARADKGEIVGKFVAALCLGIILGLFIGALD
jgi:hypothetical protein